MSPRRQADSAISPLECCGQKVPVDPGLVVEALEIAGRDQLDEVAVALLVLAQQDQVVVAVRVGADRVPLLRDVDLAADDGMDALVLGGVVELNRAEQVAVVGHGHGRHALLLGHAS